jgi:ABC-type oligopeptide transport system substrate-binding subunit
MGILHGSDAVQSKSGVRMMPVAAANMVFEDMKAGQYDALDLTRRNVWADESNLIKVIDGNLGFVLTDCL